MKSRDHTVLMHPCLDVRRHPPLTETESTQNDGLDLSIQPLSQGVQLSVK